MLKVDLMSPFRRFHVERHRDAVDEVASLNTITHFSLSALTSTSKSSRRVRSDEAEGTENMDIEKRTAGIPMKSFPNPW